MSRVDVEPIYLRVVDRKIRILCRDFDARSHVVSNFGQMQADDYPSDLTYVVGRRKQTAGFFIQREGQLPLLTEDVGRFLFLFEKDLTIQLQKLRQDLYFVHSAALELAGRACILVAAATHGKSTTTWALLHHGFRYLSDELGPVDPTTLEVHPYAHALSLKEEPPSSYPLPEATLATSRALLVPVEALPSQSCTRPVPLAAILFVCYQPDGDRASLRSVSSAEAGARLFANALNPLAHPNSGLDVAIDIAKKSACFELLTRDLPATCDLVKTTLEDLFCTPFTGD